MAAIAEARKPRSAFLEFLAVELAPREGRALAVAHIAIACALTVVIAMIFRIPEPTYMAYIVFLVSQRERSATVMVGVVGQLAVTLAVVLSLGLMLVDLSEPAVRLPAMALYTFLAMYAVRASALGPLIYLAGFVLVMLQSVVDDVPNPEALTHLSLWIWVVLLVPVVITVTLNLLFGQTIVLLTQRTVRKVLREMEAALLADDVQRHLAEWRELLVPLIEKQPKGGAHKGQRPYISVAALRRLSDALVILEALPETNAAAVREMLVRKVRACRATLEGDGDGALRATAAPDAMAAAHGTATLATAASDTAAAAHGAPEESLLSHAAASAGLTPPALAFEAALAAFQREIERPGAAPVAAAHKRQLFVPDAFTNPAHWQFALKTTLAVMVVYFIYTMLNWPGMRTSIVTCFFVALGSLGETVHKLVLRLSGALIGGLIAALCIVFVLPHMTDIGQLCLLIAVVSAGAGWVATSSELLSYAGLQIAFAFFLGILQGYGPATDLTVLRDRVAGIVLGNLVITLVFTLLWPESATSKLQSALTEARAAINAVLKRSGDPGEARVRTAQALVHAHLFSLIRRFELSMLPKHPHREGAQVAQVTDAERSAGEAFVATYEIT